MADDGMPQGGERMKVAAGKEARDRADAHGTMPRTPHFAFGTK